LIFAATLPLGWRHVEERAVPLFRSILSLLVGFSLLGLSPRSLSAQENDTSALPASKPRPVSLPPMSKRPKIGLVLAGGGALGMAHVGVLKVLEENRIPVDIITGTSMGSIVGAAYASGATVPEMEQVLADTDWDALFDEATKREDQNYRDKYGYAGRITGSGKIGISEGSLVTFAGVVKGQNVLPLLQNLYHRTPGDVNFDKLPIPYRAVAADIETGEPVVLGSGELARAARASMAVPGFFTPVELNGKTLVDGGIANNLPVDIALEMGAQRLIVVDLMADLKKKKDLDNLLSISGQIISLLLQQNSMLQRKLMRPGDILLLPDLKGYSATDFKKAEEIFAKGEEAAREQIKKLRHLSVSQEEYDRWKAHREGAPVEEIVITEVTVAANSNILDEPVEEAFAFQVGQPLDTAKIEEAIKTTYQDGRFGSLTYDVQKNGDGTATLHLDAKKPSWYDQYLQLGIALTDNFDGDSFYQVSMVARFNELNRWGGYLDTRLEFGWRPLLDLDYYQPLGTNSSWFVNPEFYMDRYELPVRIDNEIIAQYERSRLVGSFGVGRNLYGDGEIEIGLARGSGRLARTIGSPELPDQDFQIGNFYGMAAWDSLDTPDFPRQGILGNFIAARNDQSLGSNDDFTQMQGTFRKPFTFGVNTVMFSADFGTNPETIPPARYFVLGGMFDLSGFQPGGVAASDFVIGRMAYYRELESLGGAFAKLDLFGGASVQAASIKSDFDQIPDDSGIIAGLVFVGADTPLVPIYFGFGLNNENQNSFYLNMGRIFSPRY
jgi:NTE family protein